MSVLYIGNGYDGTGWAEASINQAFALANAIGDENVVYRPIKMNESNASRDWPEGKRKRFFRLCGNPHPEKYDAIIQHVLPHMSVLNKFPLKPNGKSIVYFASETNSLFGTDWASKLRVHDEVWVVNSQMKEMLAKEGIPSFVIPHAFDFVELSKKEQRRADTRKLLRVEENDFLFYTISEISKRKNLAAILKAYYIAFSHFPDCKLLIKASLPGKSPEESFQHLDNLSRVVRENLRAYPLEKYPKILFLTQRLEDEQLDNLHLAGDVFVSASYGEAWSIEAFRSCLFGRVPIVPNSTGFKDWHPFPESLVETTIEPCFGADAPVGLHTAHQSWWSVNIQDLIGKLRMAYTRQGPWDVGRFTPDRGKQLSVKYSYSSVGSLMKDRIYGSQTQKDAPSLRN